MDRQLMNNYTTILKQELVAALGCTEPIAIAYAAAKARQTLGEMPIKMDVLCSGNIIKNVKGVTVPQSGGKKGMDVAALLGMLGGDADAKLEVLESITDEHREEMTRLLSTDFCTCSLAAGVENLYVKVSVNSAMHSASVEITNTHTHITHIEKDGETIFSQDAHKKSDSADKSALNVRDILDYASEVPLCDIHDVIMKQIECNTEISNEGMKGQYGAMVGRTLKETYADTVENRAKYSAAAGSDARMGGCALPVVINSGSGNQGMTVSLPVIEYARTMKASEEELIRALVVANLISLHQKRYIGSLSAYCGATSAATGAACGIGRLMKMDYDGISRIIINTVGNIGGMVCDGAKPSCAAKIASAVDAGLLSVEMSRTGRVFQSGEGIVEGDVEKTIQNIGRMGREGMRSTDEEILNIMIGK